MGSILDFCPEWEWIREDLHSLVHTVLRLKKKSCCFFFFKYLFERERKGKAKGWGRRGRESQADPLLRMEPDIRPGDPVTQRL